MGKGQSLIFEQVLLFGVAVVIFVMCFAIFQMYQSHYEFVSMNDQTRAVRNIISSHVVEMLRSDVLNTSIVVAVPKDIGGESYTMEFDGGGIIVNTTRTGTVSYSGLQALSEDLGGVYRFSGKAVSGKGEIIIYKRGYNIILGQ